MLEVATPNGRFVFEPNDAKTKHIAAFAAGSGITPVMSQIKDVLATDKKATFYLFYGNTSVKNIMFKEELKEIKDLYMDRFIPTFFLSREHLQVSVQRSWRILI
mgnify:CR=1 FL=1